LRESRVSVTSRDVAREVGVSQSTVSRALRGDPRVATATQVLISNAAKRLNYIPNAAARSLSTARTQTVGVVVSSIANPFYPQLVEILHDELERSGYRMVLLHERSGVRNGDDVIPQLRGRAVDGLVLTSSTIDSGMADHFSDRGVPVVLLNRNIDGAHADRVLSDNRLGGALAAEMLIRLGHRRIGMISGPANASTCRERDAGFLEGLARLEVSIDPRYQRRGEYSYASGHQWCRDLLSLPDPPTAVFCSNDVIAFGALDAARQLRVPVPSGLSILGYDNIEMAAWAAFDLSTISQPLAEMSKTAASLLVQRIENPEQIEPVTHVFPASLIARGTTGPPDSSA
jgi:LacI family transcriptional regulator